MHRPTELKFLKGAVSVKYSRDGDVSDEVFFQHEVIIRNIAYPELIQFIYDNVCALIENAEEDLLDSKDDN